MTAHGARPRVPRAHRPLAPAHGRQRADRRARLTAPARRGRRRSTSTSGDGVPAAQGHRGRHPRRRLASTRPTRCWTGSTCVVASVHSKLRMDARRDDPADGRRRSATRAPTCSATAPAGWSPAAAAPGRRASSTPRRSSRPAPSTTSPSRSTPGPSAATRPTSWSSSPCDARLPVLDRQRRARARASSTSWRTAPSGPSGSACRWTGSSTPGPWSGCWSGRTGRFRCMATSPRTRRRRPRGRGTPLPQAPPHGRGLPRGRQGRGADPGPVHPRRGGGVGRHHAGPARAVREAPPAQRRRAGARGRPELSDRYLDGLAEPRAGALGRQPEQPLGQLHPRATGRSGSPRGCRACRPGSSTTCWSTSSRT